MRIRMFVAALIASLSFHGPESSQAQEYQREYQTVSDAAEQAGAALASYNSFDACGDDSCAEDCSTGSCSFSSCGGGLGLGNGFLNRPGQFFAGAEYIYARASFSEALAYVINDANNPQGGAEFVEYDFDYDSSYRFYGGFQFCDCCAAITFDYARYRSSADFSVTEEAGQEIFAPYEVENPGANNGILDGSADVEIDSYDIGISKTIPLGGPLCGGGCDCGDTCCDDCCGDGCDCGVGCGCWCPAWDITWSAGVRFADVGWRRDQVGSFRNGDLDNASYTRLSFEGAGPRVGLLGRRYIGRRGFASIYAKGDLSLLVGNMAIRTDTQNLDEFGVGNPGPIIRTHSNSARRVIPVTEIEAGVSAHVGNHVTLSSGYFIAAWHDLGMRDEYEFDNPVAGGSRFQLGHYDDANILAFDGFFARAEVAY